MQRLQKSAGGDAGLEPGSWHCRTAEYGHPLARILHRLLMARKRHLLLKK